ncbi:MAG: ribose-phosphate pyrophosphokinase, partial [Aquifex sp.]
IDRLTSSPIEKVIVTNTLPVYEKKFNKLEIVSIAPLIGETIRRVHEGSSVSSLFS